MDMNGKEYTVISTFAGTGGSSLGYKWAGFKELLAIDFDSHAVECFRLNFPDVMIWHKDIKTISIQEILVFCKIQSGNLDILDGSPPCQGFSTSGKRQINDDRNDLFKEYVRLIEGLKPKVFVMENVTGMVKGVMKGRFKEILGTLKSLPYQIKCKQMNVKYHGVPQSRERLIFIGVRNDLGIEPSYPIPGRKLITVREAFKGIDNTGEEIRELSDWLKRAVKEMIPGNFDSGHVEKAFMKYKGSKGSSMSTKLLSWDKYSCTLIKSEISCTGLIHPDRQRYLTLKEAKRLCTFPDDWKFPNRQIGIARLGNAVMPKFMKAIAENIKINILDRYYQKDYIGQKAEKL